MTYIKNTDEALEYIKSHMNDLQHKLDIAIEKPKPLLNYNSISNHDIFKYSREYISNNGTYCNLSFRYKSYDECNTLDSINARYDGLINVISSFNDEIEKIKNENTSIIGHNKKVVSNITQMMKMIGIPNSYSERDLSSRARNPKYINKRAGYLSDLERNIKTSDSGYNNLQAKIKQFTDSLTKWRDNGIDKINVDMKIKIDNENKINKEKLLAVLKIKYNVDFLGDEQDVIQTLLDKCKYLKLAHYLSKNRNDWSDGPYYASIGLDSFSIDNDEDRKIYDSVNYNIKDWDGDGRVFRDSEYSYDYIFSLVDKELLSDYNSICTSLV